jgi:hypothetical protein
VSYEVILVLIEVVTRVADLAQPVLAHPIAFGRLPTKSLSKHDRSDAASNCQKSAKCGRD